jgi:hypothetical protein
MVTNTIILNFEIERGEFIEPYYFSARIKLKNKAKSFCVTNLAVQFNLITYTNSHCCAVK